MFCLVDDKGVIYKPKPKGGGWGKELRAFTDGGSHSCTLYLFIILTLEEEVGMSKAELKQGSDLGD